MSGVLANSIRLVAVATAVSGARQFTADMLRLWSVPSSLADDACLVTSELTTNAVCATGSLEPEPSLGELAGLPLIGLQLTLAHGRLIIEVADVSDVPPVIQQQRETAEEGRGLFLVTMLAEQWSYYPIETGGKVVWAELALARSGEQNGAVGAPGHVTVNTEALADVAMLERVLWGLQTTPPLDRQGG
jgi:anti-sigma regulatory factor (Ser/Thr protein kinase)